MSTLSLRLPESLHDKVRELAEQEDTSINQFITLAVAEKMSAVVAEEYLTERAKRGSRQPKVTKPVVLSGHLGDDAKQYQVRAVALAIEESKKRRRVRGTSESSNGRKRTSATSGARLA